jgi:hypothetical protein
MLGGEGWSGGHRRAIPKLSHDATTRSQDAVDFGHILTIRIEEVRNIDEKNLIECRFDPGKRAERSFQKNHTPLGNGRLIHASSLPKHSMRLVNSEHLAIGDACGNCP